MSACSVVSRATTQHSWRHGDGTSTSTDLLERENVLDGQGDSNLQQNVVRQPCEPHDQRTPSVCALLV